MSTGLVIWAQQGVPPDLSTPLRSMGGTTSGVWILLAALAGVTLLVFLWAAFLLKRRRHGWRHNSHHSSRNGHNHAPVHTSEPVPAENHSRRKRRRRRRAHRPRNPTLAETGGLPPIRSERPPEPFP